MACVAASAATWRDQGPRWSASTAAAELRRAWTNTNARTRKPGDEIYQDWAQFRAATLREARRRGLDFSITGLGT